jgi:tetratricopeptide (TPR) repeat protein
VQAAEALPSTTLKFLEARVHEDPDDVVAENRLANLCLENLRATGDFSWLKRARTAAAESLRSVPAARNAGGLEVTTRVEYESHHFGAAREHALELTKLEPAKAHSFALLGDALLEVGDLKAAGEAFDEMQKRDGEPLETETRWARFDLAEGRLEQARIHFEKALMAARALQPARADVTAWCLVQLGQLAFATGDWDGADGHYEAALQEISDEPHALEHQGELRAAQRKYDEAIDLYQRAIEEMPRPEFWQGLGDVYETAGQMENATTWHRRARDAFLKDAEEGNVHYFHHLAGYFADVEGNPEAALMWARRDAELRHTAATHDGIAWACYRGGNFAVAAQEASAALASGTKDAHILFHAGLIFLAAGDAAKGREFLDRAARVNPRHMAFHVHR